MRKIGLRDLLFLTRVVYENDTTQTAVEAPSGMLAAARRLCTRGLLAPVPGKDGSFYPTGRAVRIVRLFGDMLERLALL